MTRPLQTKSLVRRNLRRSTCALSTVFSRASRYGTVNTPLLLDWCMVISALPIIATSTFLPIQSRKSMSTSSFLHPKLSAWQLSSSHTQILQLTVKLSQPVTLLMWLQLLELPLSISISSLYLTALEANMISGASQRTRTGMTPSHHRLRISQLSHLAHVPLLTLR